MTPPHEFDRGVILRCAGAPDHLAPPHGGLQFTEEIIECLGPVASAVTVWTSSAGLVFCHATVPVTASLYPSGTTTERLTQESLSGFRDVVQRLISARIERDAFLQRVASLIDMADAHAPRPPGRTDAHESLTERRPMYRSLTKVEAGNFRGECPICGSSVTVGPNLQSIARCPHTKRVWRVKKGDRVRIEYVDAPLA